MPLFNAGVQGYLIDLFSHDPAALAKSLQVPLLVVQGDRDIQIGVEDARALHAAAPSAELAIVPGMSHVLKPVNGDTPAASLATYGDASLPIASEAADAIAGFVKRER